MWLNGAVFANTGSVLVNVRVGEEMYQRRGGSKYFESEKGLQDYMLKNKMINHSTYIKNVAKRLIVQKLMPNKLRGWGFRTFARKKYHELCRRSCQCYYADLQTLRKITQSNRQCIESDI